MRSKKGYTLIEILVVLALLSILLSIAVPNFSLYKSMRQDMELKRLKKDLLYTRNTAILQETNYWVVFVYSTNSYTIIKSKNGEVIKTVAFESGLKLNNRSSNITFIFNRNGTVGSAGTLVMEDNRGKELKLIVTPVTGNVRIE